MPNATEHTRLALQQSLLLSGRPASRQAVAFSGTASSARAHPCPGPERRFCRLQESHACERPVSVVPDTGPRNRPSLERALFRYPKAPKPFPPPPAAPAGQQCPSDGRRIRNHPNATRKMTHAQPKPRISASLRSSSRKEPAPIQGLLPNPRSSSGRQDRTHPHDDKTGRIRMTSMTSSCNPSPSPSRSTSRPMPRPKPISQALPRFPKSRQSPFRFRIRRHR